MSDNTLISDSCLVALTRDGDKLQDLLSLQQFLQPLSQRIVGYAKDILLCLQKNFAKVLETAADSSLSRPTKTERKAILKATWSIKKTEVYRQSNGSQRSLGHYYER